MIDTRCPHCVELEARIRRMMATFRAIDAVKPSKESYTDEMFLYQDISAQCKRLAREGLKL